MREIGGYLELERNFGEEYHKNAIALNCGRNALVYFLKDKEVCTIHVPYFICSSVTDSVKKSGVMLKYYNIDSNLRPVLHDVDEDDWVYLVNFYGQFGNDEIIAFREKYKNVIVDNAQAFFQFPVTGVPTLYTCRKFFGVSDGAYLYGVNPDTSNLKRDYSFDRMRFLMGRFEKTANEFYGEYVANNHMFCDEPVKKMSKLTHNLLCGIDYEKVKGIRNKNFQLLDGRLGKINCLQLKK